MSRGRRSRLLAYFAITMIALCNTIRHMFQGVKPFDWLMLGIETAVLGLILYEVVADEIRRRAGTRRQAFIHERALGLSALWDKGQRIRSIVPNAVFNTEREKGTQWIAEGESWVKETESFLDRSSSRALESFMCVTDAFKVSVWINDSRAGFFVRGEVQPVYQRMVVQLENLHRIIERPEAYF